MKIVKRRKKNAAFLETVDKIVLSFYDLNKVWKNIID